MKPLLALALAAAAAGLVLGLVWRALRPVRRCIVCDKPVPDADPLETAVCSWHWGQGGDA